MEVFNSGSAAAAAAVTTAGDATDSVADSAIVPADGEINVDGIQYNADSQQVVLAPFPRYKGSGEADIPDLIPSRVQFDTIKLSVRFYDGMNIDSELVADTAGSLSADGGVNQLLSPLQLLFPPVQVEQLQQSDNVAMSEANAIGSGFFDFRAISSMSWVYSKYGTPQPFSFKTSRKVFEAVLQLKRGLGMGIIEWMKKAPAIGVELYVSSTTCIPPVGASTGNNPPAVNNSIERKDTFRRVAKGTLDLSSCAIEDDCLTFTCRDDSAQLWEQKLYGSGLAPDCFGLLGSIVQTFGIPAIISIIEGDVDDESRLRRKIGVKDARLSALTGNSEDYFLIGCGQRYWDVLQLAAELCEANAFFMNGTLFFINDGALRAQTGRFMLEYGKNLKSLHVQHAAMQSTGSVLVMAVADTTGGNNAGGSNEATASAQIAEISRGSGTYYIVVSGTNGVDVRAFSSRPKASQFGKRKMYVVERYNVLKDPAVAEAQKLYRDLVKKEVVCKVEIAGHCFADLLERYVLTGLPGGYAVLNDQEMDVQLVSHTIDGSGWKTCLTLNNEVVIS